MKRRKLTLKERAPVSIILTPCSKAGHLVRLGLFAGIQSPSVSATREGIIERYNMICREIGERVLLEARRAGWKP